MTPGRAFPRTLPIIAGLLTLLSPDAARAQCGGHWLPGLGVPGANDSVDTSIVSPDGDVIVGGHFTAIGSTAAAGIARWNPTTGQWSPLGGGVIGNVFAIAPIPAASGAGWDLLVGGQFTRTAGGLARNIARYTTATGQWSAIGTGCNDFVYAMAPLPGGDVLVGGAFTLAGGQGCGRIARLNPATNVWTPAGGDGLWKTTNSYGFVYALAPLPSGDVMVGGDFDMADALPSPAMARYQPATDSWAFAGTEGGYTVRALTVMPDGNLFLGGTHSGSGSNALGLYNLTSTSWVNRYSTATYQGAGYGYSAASCLSSAPNQVVAGGNFSRIGTLEVFGLARLNLTSGAWTGLGGFTSARWSDPANINTIAHPAQGDTIVGGGFAWAGSAVAYNLARMDEVGAWHPMASGVAANMTSLLALGNGDALVGGNFRQIGSVHSEYVALYHATTRRWSALGTGTIAPVYAMAKLPDGRVWLGRVTTTTAGQQLIGVDLCDPAAGTVTDFVDGQLGFITSIQSLPNGDAIVAGSFSTFGGVPVSNIARVGLASGAVTPLGPGVNGTIGALALMPNGDLVAGGGFTAAGPTASPYLARYSFATGGWSAMSGPNNWVFALAVDRTGNLYAGGSFTQAGQAAANHIGRWSAASQQWSAVGGGVNASIESIDLGPDGSLVAGGEFSMAGSTPVNYIARYDPQADAWSALGLGPGPDKRVFHVAQATRNDVLAVGEFGLAAGAVSNTFAHFSTRPTCAADFNCSGGVEPQDVFDFLNAWFAADPSADIDGYGLDVQDIFTFIAVWFSGC